MPARHVRQLELPFDGKKINVFYESHCLACGDTWKSSRAHDCRKCEHLGHGLRWLFLSVGEALFGTKPKYINCTGILPLLERPWRWQQRFECEFIKEQEAAANALNTRCCCEHCHLAEAARRWCEAALTPIEGRAIRRLATKCYSILYKTDRVLERLTQYFDSKGDEH